MATGLSTAGREAPPTRPPNRRTRPRPTATPRRQPRAVAVWPSTARPPPNRPTTYVAAELGIPQQCADMSQPLPPARPSAPPYRLSAGAVRRSASPPASQVQRLAPPVCQSGPAFRVTGLSVWCRVSRRWFASEGRGSAPPVCPSGPAFRVPGCQSGLAFRVTSPPATSAAAVVRFVALCRHGKHSAPRITLDLAAVMGVSWQSTWKWVNRCRIHGRAQLASRMPRASESATSSRHDQARAERVERLARLAPGRTGAQL
ncbi:hypothetical protein H4W33_008819 [Kibdelosporangium phytohabitans]|nr:hypothetical protein [Kibdelosporangium phytohabitans]